MSRFEDASPTNEALAMMMIGVIQNPDANHESHKTAVDTLLWMGQQADLLKAKNKEEKA